MPRSLKFEDLTNIQKVHYVIASIVYLVHTQMQFHMLMLITKFSIGLCEADHKISRRISQERSSQNSITEETPANFAHTHIRLQAKIAT
jgi:hypothetical protein